MRSFTLVEIVVVISIVLILTVLAFPNFRDASSKFALDRSAYRLAQDLRGAEEMAISSQIPPSRFGSSLFPKGGYGLYFKKNSNSYILFADCDGDGKYDSGEGKPNAENCSEAAEIRPFPEKIKDIYFELKIQTGTLSPMSMEDNSLSITFFPPDPTVKIYPLASTASIELFFGNKSKNVSISSNGLIEIH